jgi:uncharacterized protein YkuJ
MKTIFKAGLLAFLLGGAIAIPVQEAEAATHCYVRNGHWVCNGANVSKNRCYIRNGRQICNGANVSRNRCYIRNGRKICNRGYGHDSRTVCKTYWRDGTRHTRCRRIY